MVAGVSVDEKGMETLRELGVKDSKLLSPARRELLYPEIRRLAARVCTVRIPPRRIDAAVRSGVRLRKLNYLEAVCMAQVIDWLGAGQVTVDASDVIPARFGEVITNSLKRPALVRAAHHADRDDIVVSAASVVAKVVRDRAVAGLRRKHGDFGSGYPSDPKTRRFMREWVEREDSMPGFMRRSWKTWDRLDQKLMTQF